MTGPASRASRAGPSVTREHVLAYRARAQQLGRPPGATPSGLAVLDLGAQDSPAGTAAATLAARLPATVGPEELVAELADPERWVLAWSVRGAPHLYRAGDLRAAALATWPSGPEDAAARLSAFGSSLRARGDDPVLALHRTATALAAVVRGPMAKGDVSAAVTAEVPEYAAYCRRCDATHVNDQLMRLAALPAGLRLVPGTSPVTLEPVPGWPGVPERPEGAEGLVAAYLRLHGPATPKEVAAYLQAPRAAVAAAWPTGLAEVDVAGRRAWLPEDCLDALVDAPPARMVRLLPRSDPWLLSRDRELTVPDAADRKVLWPTLGFPGGVLADGEVVGTWRARAAGRRLDVTVRPFPSRAAPPREPVEEEAAMLARLRGARAARVTIEAP